MRRSSSSSSISSQWSTFSDDLEIGQLNSIIPVNTTTTAATTITTATATTASNSSIISTSSAAVSASAASVQDMNMSDSRPSSSGYERSRQGSTSSIRSCGGMSPDATKELWKTMLELQDRYGCYTSARMDLAVAAGDIALSLMPNPFILDTLNDSVVDLPDEGWEMLNRCLQQRH
ncbi:hypothetical protein ACSS6W_007677 [Trichoderma asperelloides]|uniref:Uncharacterized protein n=1 Tax=Trichoderma asperellum TaxID=101201 RepID=A0A6V8R7A1_TRIAP|nr:hypothetical protein LI328DRAFT_71192 [Trichoderma asperelloides]GFP60162.1 hypothetical protein TASIC1_0016005000 [Trichoderma asperellum]